MSGSRAELLAEQQDRLADLERRLTSVRRLLLPGLVQALALAIGILAVDELRRDPGAVGWQVAGGVAAALLAVVLVRHGVGTRALEREVRHWADLDRTAAARALPPGELRIAERDLRTVHDARDDADLPAVAADRALAAGRHVRDLRLVPGPVLAAAPAALGLALLLGPLLDDDPWAARLVGIAVGGGCLVSALGAWVTMIRESLRRQGVLNRAGVEREAYLARARALGTAAAPPDPQLPRWARRLAQSVVAALLGLLWGWSLGGATLTVMIAATLALAGVVAPLAVRRAQARAPHVVPLGAGGTDLLHGAGSGRVRIEPVAAGLRLVPLDDGVAPVLLGADDILAVEPANLPQLGAPDGVVVVTHTDPVVLGGRDIRGLLLPLAPPAGGVPTR
ncbi:hypothetical protein [Nocardioides ochotonae]|uniref:hypothetical protein n=1 Tax=Nocardioides ochotonae TaxID=2685869 RepID=UPI001407B34D|nr:hypothetical protein [Nocardioides ochotonae]